MHGHHRHLVGVLLLIVILIRQQRHFRQKVDQACPLHSLLTMYLAKFGDTFQQFLQILLLAHAFHGTILNKVGRDTAPLYHQLRQFLDRQALLFLNKTLYQLPKIVQLLGGPAIDRESVRR